MRTSNVSYMYNEDIGGTFGVAYYDGGQGLDSY